MNDGNGTALMEVPPQQQSQVPARRVDPTVGRRGIEITSMTELWQMAKAISASGLAPRGMEKAETLFVALEMGAEMGLAPMASVRSIAVINGRPAIYGDAALALVRASGLLESFAERLEGTGDAMRAICISKRRGMPEPRITTFSVADAKRAALLGKSGPWTQYLGRMLQFRARGFNLRDEFGDVLQGLYTVEEAQDIPPDGVTGLAAKDTNLRERLKIAEQQSEATSKITSRPVSEGQTFVPDPAAAEPAQDPADDLPPSAMNAAPVAPDAPEPDVSDVGDAAEPRDPFLVECEAAAAATSIDPAHFDRAMAKAMKLADRVKKGGPLKPEARAIILKAIADQTGFFAPPVA